MERGGLEREAFETKIPGSTKTKADKGSQPNQHTRLDSIAALEEAKDQT